MSIKVLRQNTDATATAAPPPSLQYGMISCDKSGCLYVGDSSNNVVEQMNVVKYQEVGNPNLLDNSDFENPINQRGKTSYSGPTGSATVYTVDRWYLNDKFSSVSIESGSISLASSSNGLGLAQKIEIPVDETYTLSAKINGVVQSITGVPGNAPVSNTNLYLGSNGNYVEVVLGAGGILGTSVYIEWAKLEKGSAATPYVPKGYGAELAECLLYYQKIFVDWRTYPPLNTLIYRIPMTTLQLMRISPTITKPDTPYTFGCDITGLTANRTSFTVQVTVNATGVGSGAAALLGNFDLSADL